MDGCCKALRPLNVLLFLVASCFLFQVEASAQNNDCNVQKNVQKFGYYTHDYWEANASSGRYGRFATHYLNDGCSNEKILTAEFAFSGQADDENLAITMTFTNGPVPNTGGALTFNIDSRTPGGPTLTAYPYDQENNILFSSSNDPNGYLKDFKVSIDKTRNTRTYNFTIDVAPFWSGQIYGDKNPIYAGIGFWGRDYTKGKGGIFGIFGEDVTFDGKDLQAIVMPLPVSCPGDLPEFTIDFNDLTPGEIVTDQFEGLTFRAQDLSGNKFHVVAIDTNNPPAGFTDLGTPTIPDGPGKSRFGLPGFDNHTDQKIALTISEGVDANDDGIIDKITPRGGLFIIDLEDKGMPLLSIDAIDAGDDVQSSYQTQQGTIQMFLENVPHFGGNSFQTLNMVHPKNVLPAGTYSTRLVMQIKDTGGWGHFAVDNLRGCSVCPAKDIDACGVCNGPGKDECGFCPGTLNYGKGKDDCGLCPGMPNYGKGKDDCGLCIGDEDYNKGKDECGLCPQDGKDYGLGFDSCDLCPGEEGYGQGVDECGFCPDDKDYGLGEDECGNCPDDVEEYPTKVDLCGFCPGMPGFEKGPDECGLCFGEDGFGKGEDVCEICPNEPGYGQGTDECGFCFGEPGFNKPIDECGYCFGHQFYEVGKDSCDRCQPDEDYGNPICDCPNDEKRDECGVCGGDGKDECGLCPADSGYGEGKDDCGLCMGHPGYEKGEDECGFCPQDAEYGMGLDACGLCPGDENYGTGKDICGFCPGDDDFNTGQDECGLCPGMPNYGVGKDECGFCIGDEDYNKGKDECGLCPGDESYGDGRDECNYCPGETYYGVGQDECERCQPDEDFGDPVCDCPNDEIRDECGICGGSGMDECNLCPENPGYGEGMDECGLCPIDENYGDGKDLCNLCPADDDYGKGPDLCERCPIDPEFGEPCDDCPQGTDICGVCEGDNSSCCGVTQLAQHQFAVDGDAHRMEANHRTLARRYANVAKRHGKYGSKVKNSIRESRSIASNAKNLAWSATWSFNSEHIFCQNTVVACSESSNRAKIDQAIDAAAVLYSETEKMFKGIKGIIKRRRSEDIKVKKACKQTGEGIVEMMNNFFPESTQNCNLN